MRKIKFGKRVLATVIIATVALVGCGETKNLNAPYKLGTGTQLESGVVAENESLVLKYDDSKHNIVLESKKTGSSWGTTPIGYAGEDADVLSAIKIEVIDNITKVLDFDRSYTACVESGNYTIEKIENGIAATYYFDAYQISVPVSYILRDDSLQISLNTAEICEGEKYRLMNVDVAPFLGAVKNNTKDAYLMIPSANGALMYTDTRVEGIRNFSAEVYGEDASRVTWEKPIETDTVKMPVFGTKREEDALFVIVEEGAEAAIINGTAGNDLTGYSTAYASIAVRGYDVYADELDASSTTTVRNADYIKGMQVSIGYYPLEGNVADYNGMAKLYKEYLTEKGLEKSESSQLYAVSILGGIRTRSLLFGVPYYSVKSMTSFEETETMVKELAELTGSYPAVQMVGFGESGINVGKVAGGFDFDNTAGKNKEFRSLKELSEKEQFLLSVDYDVLRFNKTSGMANTWMDTAKSSSLYKTECYYNSLALGNFDKEGESYYLIKRSKLPKVMDKVEKEANKLGITSISLSSLGQLAYSDYSDENFYTKGETEKSVTEEMQALSESGFSVVTDNANIYAAMQSDSILNVDLEAAQLHAIDEYIPFYQMVLAGTKPMYSEALNLTDNEQKTLLRALESGTRPGYTLIKNYDTSYANSAFLNLFNTSYDDVKVRMEEQMGMYADYYTAIEGAAIVKYEILESGVSKTVFDNGVTAYTNQTDREVKTEIGSLPAMSFNYRKGE